LVIESENTVIWFQSAPGAEAGGKQSSHESRLTSWRFQSAPGAEAGGKDRLPGHPDQAAGFQSAPGAEAGGKPWRGSVDRSPMTVSIRPRR